jgi:hypothetical protein
MTIRRAFAVGMVAVLTSSCATSALWRSTDPSEYVSVPQSEVSESELQESGVSYRKDDSAGVYYVEKTGLRRLGDYAIRGCATPVTVCLDVLPVITCIGAVLAFQGAVQHYGGRCGPSDFSLCYRVSPSWKGMFPPSATPIPTSAPWTPVSLPTVSSVPTATWAPTRIPTATPGRLDTAA